MISHLIHNQTWNVEISVLIKKKLEKGLKRFVCVTAKSDDFVEKSTIWWKKRDEIDVRTYP